MLKMIKTETLNRCLANWVYSFMPENSKDMTITLDGKTICSTNRIEKLESPLHMLEQRKECKNLCCIGAIHTEFDTKNGKSSEWHYYITSRKLTAEQLFHHARIEWSVESMYWLLDVHFEEDWCLVEDKAVQQYFNMFRKAAINLIKLFKERTKTKRAISNIMLDCLIDFNCIVRVVGEN